LHASPWLQTTLSYQIVKTEFKQDTRAAFDPVSQTTFSPSGYILAGNYDAHIYSLGATLTPRQRLALSGTFSYQDTSTTTITNAQILPYKGGVYSALVSGTYLLNKSTDLQLNYSFSFGNYSEPNPPNNQNSFLTPPPLGILYHQHALQAAVSHRFNKRLTTRLQYGFYLYDEPSLAGANNYTAQSIFATLTYHMR
jgi:hypothetical protein